LRPLFLTSSITCSVAHFIAPSQKQRQSSLKTLQITDPISKNVEMLLCPDYSSEEAIKTLKALCSRMFQKGFNMFFYIRSDAGSNFTSKAFSDWCKEENITLTVAAPRHQEQNAFVERAYGTCSKMACAMLV
jgi:hypothetical protein